MNLNKIIKEKVVDTGNSHKFTTITGEILSIDHVTNTCTVRVPNQFGAGYFELDKVPITLTGNGVVVNNYSVGDKVIVDFVGGSVSAARITGLSYYSYNDIKIANTHYEQELHLSIESTEFKKLITQEEALLNNTEPLNEYYASVDIDGEYYDFSNNIGKYNKNDIGLTNVNTGSTVILKNNGDILISTGKDATILLKKTGETLINSKKIYLSSINGIDVYTPNDINIKCKKLNVEEGEYYGL